VYHSLVRWLTLLGLLLVVGVARASTEDSAAETLFTAAEADDAAGRYAKALEEYRAAVTRSPSFRYAQRAISRADVLASHAEGGFLPFAELERVRSTPALADDPAAVDALARDAEHFPPGAVRVEARMFVAEAYLRRLHRREEALAELRSVIGDPAVDSLTARQAGRALVEALEDAGDLDGAADAAKTVPLDPRVRARVRAHVRRRWAHRASIVDLAAFAALAAFSIGAAARRGALDEIGRALRGSGPIALGFAAYVAIAGGLLATRYESGNAMPFVVMGAAVFPLALVARAWGAAGSNSPLRRAARAALCSSSVVATGFLVLEHVNAAYLGGFGL
jgi:hypothetical protein